MKAQVSLRLPPGKLTLYFQKASWEPLALMKGLQSQIGNLEANRKKSNDSTSEVRTKWAN